MIAKREIELKDPGDQPHGNLKPKPASLLDDCIDKHIIYESIPSSDFQLGDYVKIWTEECKYGHGIHPVWVGLFVIDVP